MLQIKGFPPKENMVRCAVCKNTVSRKFTVYVEKLGRVCNGCAFDYQSYSKPNEVVKGRKAKQPSFSFEFETSRHSPELLILYRYGFFPSEDGSIGGAEWKSPIYRNMRPFRRVCFEVLDRFRDFVRGDCGTHVHVACPVKSSIWRADWEYLFGPLVDYLYSHRWLTTEFFGRFFNDFCRPEVYGESRYEAFSRCSRYETLEFRLPVFRSAEQYYRVVRFCRDVTKRINDYYWGKYEDEIEVPALKRLGENILQTFKRYAEVQ